MVTIRLGKAGVRLAYAWKSVPAGGVIVQVAGPLTMLLPSHGLGCQSFALSWCPVKDLHVRCCGEDEA